MGDDTASTNRYAPHLLSCLISVFIVACIGLSCRQDNHGPGTRPNVIFIITDDQKLETFGFLEHKALTPRIDSLAGEGLYFSNAFVASSVCTPSRYTCLTGQYASRCRAERFLSAWSVEGVPQIAWNLGILQDQKMVSGVLKDAGYLTGFVGKWHVGGISDHWKPVPPGSDPADPEVAQILRQNHDGYCTNLKERYGFDYAGAVYNGNPNDDRCLVNTGLNVHNMEWLTQAALRFIESSANEPFYLYFAPTLLHVPDPVASLKTDPRKCGAGLLDEPVTGVIPSRESVLQRVAEAGLPEELAGATWLDDGIGAILDKLDELSIADNTLVIYYNDNGLENHAKGTCYEGGIRVPVIARWKGRIKPGSGDRFISNVDFVPTILDVCGVEKPDEMVLDGRSLLPLMKGENPGDWRTSVYLEVGYTRALRTGDWKYIAFRVPPSKQRTREERLKEYEPYYRQQIEQNPWMKDRYPFNPEAPYYQLGVRAGGYAFEWGQLNPEAPFYHNYFDSDQLYDLRKDPLETTNLAYDPAMAGRLEEMKGLLKKHMESLPGTFSDLLEK